MLLQPRQQLGRRDAQQAHGISIESDSPRVLTDRHVSFDGEAAQTHRPQKQSGEGADGAASNDNYIDASFMCMCHHSWVECLAAEALFLAESIFVRPATGSCSRAA